jgi:hypothetical protein
MRIYHCRLIIKSGNKVILTENFTVRAHHYSIAGGRVEFFSGQFGSYDNFVASYPNNTLLIDKVEQA